jgi:serpin B
MDTLVDIVVIVIILIVFIAILLNSFDLGIYTSMDTFKSKYKTLRDTFQLNTPNISKISKSKKCNILENNEKEIIQKIAINSNIINIVNDLDAILLNYYIKQDDKNILVSPFSLLSCSALLLQLLFNNPKYDSSEEHKQLITMFKITDPIKFINDLSKTNAYLNKYINTYNSILINSNIIIKDSYKKKIKLLGEYNSFDPTKAEDVVIDINNDIKNKTNGMISQFVTNNDINPDTTIILLNNIYFKGSWVHKFNKSNTITKKFNGLKGEKQVQMMILNKERFHYFEDVEKQVICLEYESNYGNPHFLCKFRSHKCNPHSLCEFRSHECNEDGDESQISMVIILPRSTKNIYDINYDIKEVFNNLFKSSKKKVDIEIPKFECTSSLNLIPFFKNHNVTKIFESFDISSILEKEYNLPVLVSKFIQNTKVIVDENGTEAAAITLCINNKCMSNRTEIKHKFIADHPFKYYIIHDKSLILFSGSFI